MTLGEKIRYLREVEGSLRGLGRAMTQLELVRAIRKEQGKSISQSYVSQIEGGSRPHMTQSTRTLLAKFSRSTPGFSWMTRRDTTPSWFPICAPSKASWMSGSCRVRSDLPAILK